MMKTKKAKPKQTKQPSIWYGLIIHNTIGLEFEQLLTGNFGMVVVKTRNHKAMKDHWSGVVVINQQE